MIKAYLKDGVITLAPEGRKKAEFTAGAALTTIGEKSSMINPYTFFDDFEESTFQTLVRTELDRLFERFYRADPSRSRDQGGYGLGLAIAREIMTRLGARLTVRSELGEGSEFSFTLRQENQA